MSVAGGPKLVTDGLLLNLDASSPKSIVSGAAFWNDLSQNNHGFNVNVAALQRPDSPPSSVPYMDFGGSYGAAKRVVGGSLVDVSKTSAATICLFSRPNQSNGVWRTLLRAKEGVGGGDHNVIIEQGAEAIGKYMNSDGHNAGFMSSSYNVTSIPLSLTVWNYFCFTITTEGSPYWAFYLNSNQSTAVANITNLDGGFYSSFCCIGGYQNATDIDTGPTNSSQYWGQISNLLYYNRVLTEPERVQNHNALRSRFGL